MSPADTLVAPPPELWDEAVRRHPRGHPLQSSAWGRLKGAFGWSPRLLADGSAGGPVQCGALLLLRRRAGLSAAYAPRGPLLAGGDADAALLEGLVACARAERAVFLRVEPNLLEMDPGAGELHSRLLLLGFRPVEPVQPRSSVHLDLAPEPDRLLAAMSKGHRADIRRAAREGVAVRQGEGEADFARFYAILESTAARNRFGIHERGYYRAALAEFGAAARVWLAERGGAAEAAALTLAWGGEALYLYSGSTEEGLRSGAQHAIQWEVIRWARERGCRRYDLWGVPDSLGRAALEADEGERARLEEQARSDPLHGVYRFKKGFGGQVVRYLPAYDRVLIAPLYTLWRRAAG
jgi:lipid II:glycine glycyltransferase (peptidoglycan interpeptide bridge formation enzyme)